MSTEKFFKNLKKIQDFKSLVHTIFFKSASGMKLKSQKKHKKMRSIKQLIRPAFDLTTYFSFQRTICNPKYAIFQGGVIKIDLFPLILLTNNI